MEGSGDGGYGSYGGSGSGSGMYGSGSGIGSGNGTILEPPPAWSDGGVVIVLIINITLSIILFLVWNFWMRLRDNQNDARLFDADDETDKMELEDDITKDTSKFYWLWRLIKLDNEEVTASAGVDASIYLRFQKMLIGFFVVLSILGLPFIALNVNGSARNAFHLLFYGFITTTADNIEVGSSLFWFHALFTVIVSVLSYCLILWLSVTYKRNSYHPDRIDVRSFTCMITNFPRHLGGTEDEARLKSYFEQLYRGGIYQTYILNDLKILNSIYALQKKLKHAHRKLHAYEGYYARTNTRPIITETFFQKIKHWRKSITCFGKRKKYDEIIGKDAIDYYQQKARNIQAKIVELRRVLQQIQQRAYDESRGIGLGFVTFKSITGAKRCIRDFATSEPPPPIASVSRGRRMNDIEEKRRTYDHLNVATWRVRKAPHPDDIRWRSLLIPDWQVFLRVLAINTVLFIFFFFFTTPLAIVGGLRQFLLLDDNSASQTDQNFGSMLHESWFEALIIGFVPTVLMAFLSFLIPIFLERATKYEGHHTTSHLDRAAMRKIFTFLFLSNVILPAVFLSSLDAVVSLATEHTPVQVAERLGNVAPNWSFFLNFLINLTFLGSTLTLMRLPNWIQMKWKQMNKSIFVDEYFNKSEKFRWGYRYSLNLLVFAIGVFLSTFIPVILPTAALFFIIRLPVDKYNLLVTHNHTRSDFHIMKTVRRIMLVVVGTFQIAVFLFLLFVKHTLGPALLVLGFFAVSIIFSIFDCLGVFHNLSKTETEEWTAVEDEIYKGVGGDILLEAYRDAYQHPGQRDL